MAFEIPSALIRELQVGLRAEAGVPLFDPDDPSIPPLPPVAGAGAALDPDLPDYLRCRRCRGGLLRGVNSTLCVFCGEDRSKDGFCQSISFASTAAYRGLLESLGLDGSEVVTLDDELNNSSKGQNTPKDVLTLSSLLDLELRWPSERQENIESNTGEVPSGSPAFDSDNSKTSPAPSSTVNLSGVDLDTFFLEAKKDTASYVPTVFSEQFVPKEQSINTETHEFSTSENFDLFENVSTSGVQASSANTKSGKFGDSSAVWEADFQSVSPEASVSDFKSVDLFQGTEFVGSTTPEAIPNQYIIVGHRTSVSGSGGGSIIAVDQPSSNDDWNSDDFWLISTSVSSKAEQMKSNTGTKTVELKNNSNDTTSSDHDWIPDDLWPTSSTNVSVHPENTNDNDDSFDDWQDFRSSSQVQGSLSDAGSQFKSTPYENPLEKGSVDQQDLEFGTLVLSDSFSGAPGGQGVTHEGNNMLLDASVFDKMNGMHETVGVDASLTTMGDLDINGNSTAASNTESNDSIVEKLLSQMHDLSFMLENELSIPDKLDSSGPKSST